MEQNLMSHTLTVGQLAGILVLLGGWLVALSVPVVKWLLRSRRNKNGHNPGNNHKRRIGDNLPGETKNQFDVIHERCASHTREMTGHIREIKGLRTDVKGVETRLADDSKEIITRLAKVESGQALCEDRWQRQREV